MEKENRSLVFTFYIKLNVKIRNFPSRSRAVTVKKSSKESDALSKLLFFSGISRIPAYLWIRGGTRCAYICEFGINWPVFMLFIALFVKTDRQLSPYLTGSPSSKYEHRRASALLRNIQNIRICMGKKPIVSVTDENERISIKHSLPYLKCVLRLSCVVHGPIYGHFILLWVFM